MVSLNLCGNGLQAGSADLRRITAFAAAILLVMLPGCSAVPDALNPVEWADDLDAYLSGEEVESDPELAARIEAEKALPVPGADQDFPKLSSVPGRAPAVTSQDERSEITRQLETDRANAPYTGDGAPVPKVTSTPASAAPDSVVGPDARLTPPSGGSGPAVAAAPTVQNVGLQTQPRFTETQMAQLAWAGDLDGLVHAAVIYYGDGSARLSRRDKEVLRQVAEVQKRENAIVRVVGHASLGAGTSDSAKAKIVNFEIAYDRARVVADELIRLGVPEDHVFVASASDTKPAYSESTPSGAAANRRTDIYFEYQRSPA